jgi:hypothetical protein
MCALDSAKQRIFPTGAHATCREFSHVSRKCAAGFVQPFSQSSFSQHFSDKLSLGAPSLPVSGLDSFGIGALAGGFSQDSFVDQQVWSLSPAHAMRCSQCDAITIALVGRRRKASC